MLILEHFWEDEEIDARLTEAILSRTIDKPSIWYRIFLGEEDLVAWVAGVDIRFEFNTKAEQIEFAEQLSNDLSVPLRKGRKWSDHKGALEIRTIRRS